DSMCAFVDCPAPDDAQPSSWCMPPADPATDTALRTATTRIERLPRYVAALPRISLLDGPDDWTFTRVSPDAVSGHLLDLDLRRGVPRGGFAGYAVELERRGATSRDAYAPVVLPAGAWTQRGVA